MTRPASQLWLTAQGTGAFNVTHDCTFSSQGIFNRLEKSGNYTQNTGKIKNFYTNYWKSCGTIFNNLSLKVFVYLLQDMMIEVDL